MHRRLITLTALAVAGALTVVFAQGRQGGAPPALTMQPVKPGLYAILNPGANTLAVRVTGAGVILVDDMFQQGVPKDQYISRLQAEDLGWGLGADTLFVRNAAGGFYDELAKP